jgi:hypothetical protein
VTDRRGVRERAREVAQERLLRERALLEAVSPDERAAIEETAFAIAFKVAECLVDEAVRCPPLADALTADIPAAASDRLPRGGSPDSTARSSVAGASTIPMRLGSPFGQALAEVVPSRKTSS